MGDRQTRRTSQWVYCDTIARVEGEAIRVLERNPEKGQYREKVYEERGEMSDRDTEVYVDAE